MAAPHQQRPAQPIGGTFESPDVASMMAQGMMKQAQGQKTNVPYAPHVDPQQQSQQQSQFQHQQAPRDVSSFQEELGMVATDIVKSVSDNLLAIVGLGRQPKDPEESAKLQQFHQRWQSLDQEQQQVAQQRLQAEAQKKQMEEEERQMRKQQEEEAKKQQDQQLEKFNGTEFNIIPTGCIAEARLKQGDDSRVVDLLRQPQNLMEAVLYKALFSN